MIECKDYTLNELKQVLNISARQWEEKRSELLEHLKLYFDYEITKIGRSYNIRIIEQYAEYEPLPRKSKTKEMTDYYYECTKEEVKEQPWNTGSNIARNIIAKDKNVYEHAEGTITNYVRPIVKEKFTSPNPDAQWMKLAEDKLSYIPLTEEELDYLQHLFDTNNVNNNKAKIMSLYKSKQISKREASEQIFNLTEGWYGTIMQNFKAKYKFVPITVRHLNEV